MAYTATPGTAKRKKIVSQPDGTICELQCGCQVRKMSYNPHDSGEVYVWILGRCGAARYGVGIWAPTCILYNKPGRSLAYGVRSCYVSSFVNVTVDPLANALDGAFGD